MPKPLLPAPMMNRRALLGSLGGMMVGGAAMARRPSDVVCSANAADYSVRGRLFWAGESFFWAGAMRCEGSTRQALIRKKPGQDAEVIRTLVHSILCSDGLAMGAKIKTPDGIVYVHDADGQFIQRQINSDSSKTDFCALERRMVETELAMRGLNNVQALSAGIPQVSDEGTEDPVPFLVIRELPDMLTSELILVTGDAFLRRMTVDVLLPTLRMTVDLPLASFRPSIYPDYQSGGWIAWADHTEKLVDLGFPGVPVVRISQDLELQVTWVPVQDWMFMSISFFFPVGARLGATSSRIGSESERYDGVYLETDSGWERRFASNVTLGPPSYSPDGRYLGWVENAPMSLSVAGAQHIPRIEDLTRS
jgi:hypothetical protein